MYLINTARVVNKLFNFLAHLGDESAAMMDAINRFVSAEGNITKMNRANLLRMVHYGCLIGLLSYAEWQAQSCVMTPRVTVELCGNSIETQFWCVVT